MAELLSRKDRERLTKRQDIIKAARIVFADKGLHAATLDEIAEKAEFAKGTLYGYFASKDDLFVSMLEEEIIRFSDSLKQVLTQGLPPDETIGVLVETMLRQFNENVDLMRLLSQERSALITCKKGEMELRFLPHFRRMIDMVAQLVKDGTGRGAFAKVDPERAATAIFNLCHGAAVNAFLNRKKVGSQEDAKFITRLLLHGIKAGKQ